MFFVRHWCDIGRYATSFQDDTSSVYFCNNCETGRYMNLTGVSACLYCPTGTIAVMAPRSFRFHVVRMETWLGFRRDRRGPPHPIDVFNGYGYFFRSFVLYMSSIPGEHCRRKRAVDCVTAHLRGFEEDSRSEVNLAFSTGTVISMFVPTVHAFDSMQKSSRNVYC